ncbi:MAG: metallophosphoesterase [Acidimicrobiales bacterium]
MNRRRTATSLSVAGLAALLVLAGACSPATSTSSAGGSSSTATSRAPEPGRAGSTATSNGSSAGSGTTPSSTVEGAQANPGPSPTDAWAWTQLTDKGTEIRVATPEATCPDVKVTKAAKTTAERMEQVSKPTPPHAATSMCRLKLEDGAAEAVVDSKTPVKPSAKVPIPAWRKEGSTASGPARIVVIGDTGCRTVQQGTSQDCKNQWPFQPVADSAAATKPDLVIHTGDYIYRSDPQVSPVTGCDTKDDHTWGCLVADFFHPASALLAEAPIVMVRGNHETCARSGKIWFRYQATELRSDDSCSDYSDPVSIRAGKLGLVLFDSSFADEEGQKVDQEQVKKYEPQFKAVNETLAKESPESLFLTHQPLWAVTSAGQTEVSSANRTLDTATGSKLDEHLKLVLSGHVHLYQRIDFAPASKRQPQVVVGSSGTELDSAVDDAKVVGKKVDGEEVASSKTLSEFGYAVLRDSSGSWVLDYYGRNGQSLDKPCTLKGTTLSC